MGHLVQALAFQVVPDLVVRQHLSGAHPRPMLRLPDRLDQVLLQAVPKVQANRASGTSWWVGLKSRFGRTHWVLGRLVPVSV